MHSLVGLIESLNSNRIDFIVVGGMAMVLHGAPVTTLDLDIVPSREPENIRSLMQILAKLDARYRGQPRERVIRPTEIELSGTGYNNLMTSLGPLDVLCELFPGQGYYELLPHTKVMTDGALSVRVVSLDTLIEIKLRTGRDKDLSVIPVLMKLLKSDY